MNGNRFHGTTVPRRTNKHFPFEIVGSSFTSKTQNLVERVCPKTASDIANFPIYEKPVPIGAQKAAHTHEKPLPASVRRDDAVTDPERSRETINALQKDCGIIKRITAIRIDCYRMGKSLRCGCRKTFP
jgi:hypothetical protein